MKMINRRTVIVLGILLATVPIVFVSLSALAYELSGDTWPSGVDPLTWRSFYETTELEDAFDAAMDDWDSTSTPISFDWDEEWFQVMASEYDEVDGYNGKAFRYVVNGNIIAADLWLNWNYLQGDTPNERRGTAGHEWGHCFGLSEETGSVLMNYLRTRSVIYVPQSDDINGINAMY